MNFLGIKNFGNEIWKQGIWEIIETLGEKVGLLSVERNENGKVLKRKFMGIGPEDEALNLLAWYQVFLKTGHIKEKDVTGEDLLALDRAMDHLDIIERIKVKSILGMREQEVASKVKEWIEGGKGKGQGQSTKYVEKESKKENVDGEKILHLFLSIMKIGETKKTGGGEEALILFLRGTILTKTSDVVKKVVETLNSTIEEGYRVAGKDPVIELANTQLAGDVAKAEYLAKKAARLAARKH